MENSQPANKLGMGQHKLSRPPLLPQLHAIDLLFVALHLLILIIPFEKHTPAASVIYLTICKPRSSYHPNCVTRLFRPHVLLCCQAWPKEPPTNCKETELKALHRLKPSTNQSSIDRAHALETKPSIHSGSRFRAHTRAGRIPATSINSL
jgi:hypothetical protein